MTDQNPRPVGSGAPAGGARFSAYVSPSSDTEKWLTKWALTIEQPHANWSAVINSDAPTNEVQSSNLSGTFNLTVWASGPNLPWQEIAPQAGTAQVDCNSDCSVIVGIVAEPGGYGASFFGELVCPLPIHPC